MIVGPNRMWRVWLASLLIAASGLASLWRAMDEPSLGWRFVAAPDGVIEARATSGDAVLRQVTTMASGGQALSLHPSQLIESAGIHNEYAAHNRFFSEHRQLWQILHSGPVVITHAQGQLQVQPRPRALDELGLRFWFPWLVALLSLSVGMALWVYRPREHAARCYLLASAGYAFGMLCTATWGSRLLTQSPVLWPALHVASHAASFLMIASLCALLWRNPVVLGGNWLPGLLAVVTVLCVGADAAQWVPTISLAFRLPVVLMTVGLAVIFALQWRASARDATRRAQLKWFGLLLFMGLSTVFVAYAVGSTGHVVSIPQNYGLGTVALLFLGLVPLVTRVGLFQLEAWWPRAWLWFLGGLLVVAIDVFLLAVLDFGSESAFALALALGGWIYFPLRQVVWRRLARGALPDTRDMLPEVLDLVTRWASERSELNRRWRALWEQVFQPLRIDTAAPGTPAGVLDEGRALTVAAGNGLDALQLGLPERGARLFNPGDARRAAEIAQLVQHGLAAGEAFARGAREERQRIAADLHDDLGARLLTLAQAGGSERVSAMAREALEEMRLAVRGLTAQPMLAADLLADWRAETVGRLDAAGMLPHWEAPEPPAGLEMPARTHVQVTRALREAVSNAIRHSGGTRCRVGIDWTPDSLAIDIEDDGPRPTAGMASGQGHGLPNIERRIRSLQGRHEFTTGGMGGVLVRLRVPLKPLANPLT